ncbi:methyltransferase domain-containing protein [Candidatus Omnitrophota bacterium]
MRAIAKSIFDICLAVEKNIAGLSEIDSRLWAKANTIRHSHVIKAIIDYAAKTNKRKLRILNASGISCGHQDFSIVSYLREKAAIAVDWTVFESPHNLHLKNEFFTRSVEDLKIDLRLSDFSKSTELYGEGAKEYDLVIFSEIAEHMDHSVLLKSLIAVRRKVKEDGIVIVTTPNLLKIANRIRLLFGNAAAPYWGEGMQNLNKGLYGHITYYDLNRLKRLLADVGLSVEYAYTYNYGRGSRERHPAKYILFKCSDIISLLFKGGRDNLFIVARRATPKEIPFET